MADVNLNPIFSRIGAIGGANIYNAAVTTSDGVGNTGSNMTRVFMSDANNGSYVQRLRLSPVGAANNIATTATVFRVYYSTVVANNTTTSAADTHLIAEVYSPSQTASGNVNVVFPLEVQLGFAMANNTSIIVSAHHVMAANSGWKAIVFGGNY